MPYPGYEIQLEALYIVPREVPKRPQRCCTGSLAEKFWGTLLLRVHCD